MRNFSITSIFILSLLIILPNFVDAQSKSRGKKSRSSKGKTEIMYTAQGGLFYDIDSYFLDPINYDLNTFGFTKFGIGQIRYKNQTTSQFLLEFSGYNKDYGLVFKELWDGTKQTIRGVRYTPILIELEYFKSFLTPTEFNNKLHAGILLNSSFSRNSINPYATNQFPEREVCFCIGGGFKAMYPFNFLNSTLLISTDINLIDFGLGYNYNGNPNIFADEQTSYNFAFNLLRPRIGLDIGFVIK